MHSKLFFLLTYLTDACLQVMGEIQRIKIEDACTKDVFRELDGVLLLINVLAVLNVYLNMDGHTITETEEGERLAFMLLAEALQGHLANQVYFEVRKSSLSATLSD